MAVNVLDGALEFSAEVNLSTFDEQMKAIGQRIQNVAEQAISSSKDQVTAVENIIKNIAPNGAPALQATIDKVKELQKEEKKFQELINTTTDPQLLTQYKTSLEGVQKLLDDAPNKINQQVNDVIAQNIKDAAAEMGIGSEAFVAATSQLRKIKNELVNTDKNDPRYQQLLEDAEQLEHKIKNVNKELELSSSNVAGIEAVGQGVRGLIGGFEAFSGVLALTSQNNEQVKKTTEHVIAAMGILNGIEELGKVIAKDSALNTYLLAQYRKLTAINTAEQAVATEVLAVAEEGQAVATAEAAVAQEELNVALSANPAGILLLALTAIIIAIQAFSSEEEDATEKQTKLNEAMAEANGLLVELADSFAELHKQQAIEAENAVSLAQAQGKSEKEIFELKSKSLKAKQDELRIKLLTLVADKNEIELKEIQLESVNSQIRGLIEMKGVTGELLASEEERLKNLESQKKAIESILNPAKSLTDELNTNTSEQDNLKAEAAKKAHDDALKSDQALAEARLILAKKNTQEELAAQINAIKERTRVELDNVNLTQGRKNKDSRPTAKGPGRGKPQIQNTSS
jgi:hypothetical protein